MSGAPPQRVLGSPSKANSGPKRGSGQMPDAVATPPSDSGPGSLTQPAQFDQLLDVSLAHPSGVVRRASKQYVTGATGVRQADRCVKSCHVVGPARRELLARAVGEPRWPPGTLLAGRVHLERQVVGHVAHLPQRVVPGGRRQPQLAVKHVGREVAYLGAVLDVLVEEHDRSADSRS